MQILKNIDILEIGIRGIKVLHSAGREEGEVRQICNTDFLSLMVKPIAVVEITWNCLRIG